MDDRRCSRRELLRAGSVGLLPGAKGLSFDSFTPAPTVEWRFDTGSRSGAHLPAVAGAATGTGDRSGSDGGTVYVGGTGLYALDARTGAERWRFGVDDAWFVRPVAAVGGTIYVENVGSLYALDRTDGSPRWSFDPGSNPTWYPTATRRSVYVLANDRLYALDPVDGTLRWEFPVGREPVNGALAAEQTVYVGSDDGSAFALDKTDGRERWRFEPFDGSLVYPVAVVNGHESSTGPRSSASAVVPVWNADRGRLSVLDAADGSVRWRIGTSDSDTAFPGTVLGDTVFLTDGRFLRAFGAADGDERWQYEGDAPLVSVRVAGETLYLGGKRVHAVAAADGSRRWTARVDGEARVGGVGDETVAVATSAREVVGFEVAGGRERWRFDPGDELVGLPNVAGGSVQVGTRDGTVYALGDAKPNAAGTFVRTATSPAGVVGGLVGGAAAVVAYRRLRERAVSDPESSDGGPESLDEFEILEALDGGKDTTVHRARVAVDGRVETVALVQPADSLSADAFLAAVETWAALDVEGVRPVRYWGREPEPWAAVEYADGGTLAERATESSVADDIRSVAAAAETVHRAHRKGVTHGRLGPESVVFADGDVSVGGWGFGDSDVPTDVRQLGALAYRVATGERPDGDPVPPNDLNGDLSPALDDVLLAALSDEPADRHDSALRFADALRWAAREG